MTLPDALFLLVGAVSLVASVGWIGWMAVDGLRWLWRRYRCTVLRWFPSAF